MVSLKTEATHFSSQSSRSIQFTYYKPPFCLVKIPSSIRPKFQGLFTVQVSLARPQGFFTPIIQILTSKPLGSASLLFALTRPQGFFTPIIQILTSKPLGSVSLLFSPARPQGFFTPIIQILASKPLGSASYLSRKEGADTQDGARYGPTPSFKTDRAILSRHK